MSDAEIPVEQRKQLVELENHHCRFPVGDPCERDTFFFCGHPSADLIGGSPYCRGHALRAFPQ